ncbi:fibronectin type III-like domain-contianing protein [Curtobacterium pusillum]|uniref:fibronectin type III-like domain-contianing protein n=1 Tax=Curtobacterium pusillum TaxID=69373 RepID=UPI001643B89D|nr:fibronectin type III-like domain-contianing protein [Curtobacterium pusillum]
MGYFAVPQLYVEHVEPGLRSPLRELRGFEKVRLDAGESTTIPIAVPREHLQRWHTGVHGWVFSGGALRVVVGRSSRDVALSAEVDVPGTPVRVPLDVYSSLAEWRDDPKAGPALEALLAERGGIRGRMADLLADETGADSVLSVPLVSLIEMPGVPLERTDVDRLLLTAAA